MLGVDRTVSPLRLPREVLELSADPGVIEPGVVHLVPAGRAQPGQLLEDERRDVDRSHRRDPVLLHLGEHLQLGAEVLLVPHDRPEGLIEVVDLPSASPDLARHKEADEVGVPAPVSEPAAHLHEAVGLHRLPLEIGDGQALEGESAAELRPADHNPPHAVQLEVDLVVLLVLVAVDDDNGIAAAHENSVEHIPDEGRDLVEGRGPRQTALPLPGCCDHLEVLVEQLAQAGAGPGRAELRLAPQSADPVGEIRVLLLHDRLVDEHCVVPEGPGQPWGDRGPPELDGPGEDEGVQRAPQLAVDSVGVVVGGPQVAYEGPLIGHSRVVPLLVGELLEVVVGPSALVPGGGAEAEDEVPGEDVLRVLGGHEDIGEGGRRVADVLGPVKTSEELSDELIDGRALAVRGRPSRVDRIHRGLVGLVVDNERGDLAQGRPDASKIIDELREHVLVLLDDGDPGVGAVDIVRVPDWLPRVLQFVAGARIKRIQARLEPLVVVLRAGEPPNGGDPCGREVPVGDEPPFLPVDVVRTGVVDVGKEVPVTRVDPAEDVLGPDELHVEAPLGLGPQELDRTGEDNDQPVASINGLGNDSGEVGGLPALDVPDHQSFGLVGGAAGGVGQAGDDVGRDRVDGGDGLGAQFSLQDLAVVIPVEVVPTTAVLVVPGSPRRVDDHGRPVQDGRPGGVDAVRGAAQAQELQDQVPALAGPGSRALGPAHVLLGVPLADPDVELGALRGVGIGVEDELGNLLRGYGLPGPDEEGGDNGMQCLGSVGHSVQGLVERPAVDVCWHVSVLSRIVSATVRKRRQRAAGAERRDVNTVVHEANEIGTGEDPCQPVGGDGGE